MKILILSFIITMFSLSCFSQNTEIDILKEKAVQLKLEIKQKTVSLKNINRQIDEIEIKAKLSKLDSAISIKSTVRFTTGLKEEPYIIGKSMITLTPRDTIIVRGIESGFYIIEHKGLIGYLKVNMVKSTWELVEYKMLIEKLVMISRNKKKEIRVKEVIEEQARRRKEATEEAVLRKKEAVKEAALLKKERKLKKNLNIKYYGKTIANKIENGEIWIGMTKSMARKSIGVPNKINKSTNAYGTKEQWVYDNYNYNYLYFTNDKLTSWQESN